MIRLNLLPPLPAKRWKIYCCTSPSGKHYIGQTVALVWRRFRQHKIDAFANYAEEVCPVFHAAIRKHGRDNFACRILALARSAEEADALESHWIEKLDSFKNRNGYNIESGGRGHTKRFCKHGHDTWVTGRDPLSNCIECYEGRKIRMRLAKRRARGLPSDAVLKVGGRFKRFCKQGHDTHLVGRGTDYSCKQCRRDRQKAKITLI